MKNITLLLASLLIILGGVFGTTAIASAQCPSGWNGPETTTINYTTSPLCDIDIIFCWTITPGGVLQTQVLYYGTDPGCIVAFLLDPAKINLMADAILAKLASLNATPIPPCSTLAVLTFTLDEHDCKFIENDNVHQIMLVKDCSTDAVCRSTYRVCIDYSGANPVLSKTLVSRSLDGSSECPDTFPVIPLDPPHGWQSTCFISPCQ